MPTEFTVRDGNKTIHAVAYKDEITGIDRSIAESRIMYNQIANDPALNRASQALAWWFAKIAFFSLVMTIPLCLTLWLRILIPRPVIDFQMKRLMKVTGGWVVIWLFATLFNGGMMGNNTVLINFSLVMGIVCAITLGIGFIQKSFSANNIERAAGNGVGWLTLILKGDTLRTTAIQDAVVGGILLLLAIVGGTSGSDLLFVVGILGIAFGYLWYYQRKFRDLLPEKQVAADSEQTFKKDNSSWGFSQSSSEIALLTDEHLVFKTKHHWWMWAWPLPLVCIILIGLRLVMGYAYYDAYTRQYAEELNFLNTIMAAAFLAGIVPIALLFLSWSASEVNVTNQRVIVKSGFINRRVVELFLPQVETCVLSIPMIGQFLGYTDIQLTGTGGTPYPLRYVLKGAELRDRVLEQIHTGFEANPSPSPQQMPDEQQASQPPSPAPSSQEPIVSMQTTPLVSSVDELEKELAKLEALHQKGLLDEDEYKELKKKIISKA